MRGKVSCNSGVASRNRITPAYAGKSLTAVLLIHGGRDHPRLCGEKLCSCRWQSWRMGSPPPMRGKDRSLHQSENTHGITPAYAGKSGNRGTDCNICWDHPRLCGEKHRNSRLSQALSGSPPPMRGKVLAWKRLLLKIGITPAYAGKRGETATVNVGFEDHPRLCGEKLWTRLTWY